MVPDVPAVGYIIWGADHAVYGPVELPVLVGWIKDERVLGETWVFVERNGCWEKAERVPELQMFFHRRAAASSGARTVQSTGELTPAGLRHIKVLSCLNDEQLQEFIAFTEPLLVPAGTPVVKRGEPANAMYLVVEGTLRFSVATE